MMERFAQALRRPGARIIGIVYLTYFLSAILGAVLTPATPTDIVAHEPLFRLGFAISLISIALYIALAALFYNLFKPVNRNLALLAAFLSLAGCVIQAFGSVFELAPFVLLGSGHHSTAFNTEQVQAVALTFLDLSTQAGYVGVVFFGLFDIVIGYLIFRSTFLPRVLGVLMVIAGLGWLIFVSPPLANSVLVFIEVPGFVAEAALMLWLLVFGVNLQRWSERAGAAGSPGLL